MSMQATFSNWRTEDSGKSSGLDPIVYSTKITKTKVIPLYRLANEKGESQDIICYLCDSFDIKTNEYAQKVVYPALSIVSVKDEIKTTNEQMSLDMIHNCSSFGIVVQDGIKEEGWKAFIPSIVVPTVIPLDDLTKYYKAVVVPVLEDGIVKVAEVIAEESVTKIEKAEKIEKVIQKVDPSLSVSINEPPYHFAVKAKGQRGRPRKVYDDPDFDALVMSIPHTIVCKGCGKDIILAPLNIIDRARGRGIEVKELLSGFKCRSCK